MKSPHWWCLLFLGQLLLAACASGATGSPRPEAKAPPAEVTSKSDWEKKWETTLAEARREGKVVIYTLWKSETRNALTQSFPKEYGIELEFLPFARGAEMLPRIQKELAAGLKIADVYGGGSGTLLGSLKPNGLLGPVEPFLILPEVLDAKAWRQGKLPFVDRDKFAVGVMMNLQRSVAVNTEIVKPGEITTYNDLLKPLFKGRIVLNDPSITGASETLLGHLALDLWNEQQALDFLRQLLTTQGAVVTRDERLITESLARGKYVAGVGVSTESLAGFVSAGAPVSPLVMRDGVLVATGAGAFSLPVAPSHPMATAVFVNWLMSKEGQTAFVKGFGNASVRLDVPTEGINPLFLPAAGEKLYFQTEESISYRTERLLKLTAEIIAKAR